METISTDWAAFTPKAALQEAIKRAGSQDKLAAICECSQGAISQMLKRDQARLGHKYVLKVEASLGIPRWVSRPDIYPVEEIERAAQAA